MASDRVAAAVAELYGADPDAFTERRKALAVAAREAGDKQSAGVVNAVPAMNMEINEPREDVWLP